jgi:hypothetical protein
MHPNDAQEIRCLLRRSKEEVVTAIRLDQSDEAAAHFARSLEYSARARSALQDAITSASAECPATHDPDILD